MKQLLCILTITALGLMPDQMVGQGSAFADASLYESVVNQLFQHQAEGRSSETQLRYTYCSTGELQIVIRDAGTDRINLEIWYVPRGSPSIWNQLAALVAKRPSLNAQQAASLLKIERKSLTIPKSAALARLLEDGRSLSVPLTGDDTITLDGMAYGLTIRSVSRNLSVTFQAPQRSLDSQSEIVRWMGKVRAEVNRSLLTGSGALAP
jgi:hypothetical protein